MNPMSNWYESHEYTENLQVEQIYLRKSAEFLLRSKPTVIQINPILRTITTVLRAPKQKELE